ncbi:MAG: hypothetical protein SGI83_02280 [Bacteroidota bacterium]|nr:hypothetical protein [Bacteroidota bacterium]
MLAAIKKYTPEAVETIYKMMQNHVQSGRKPQYEIYVDNLPIVPRTDNLNLFETYSQHIGSDSRELKIVVYQGKSNHNDKYLFRMGEETPMPQQSMGGFENQSFEGILSQRLMEAEQRWEQTRLQEKMEGLGKELVENEKYIDLLEGKIKKFESEAKASTFADILGAFGGRFVDATLQNSPKIQQMLGLGNLDNKVATTSLAEGASVSFRPKGSEDAYTKITDQMRKDFTPEEFKILSQVIYYLSKQKEDLTSIHSMIYQKEGMASDAMGNDE